MDPSSDKFAPFKPLSKNFSEWVLSDCQKSLKMLGKRSERDKEAVRLAVWLGIELLRGSS